MPEPGSGDLELRRVAAVFAWCADCGRFAGRACCWGSGQTCARCSESRAASGDAGSAFATLGAARAAVRRMDGTEADVWAAENAIAGTGSVDLDAAINAWEATWLAAAALRTRIDGGNEAAQWWLRAIPRVELERAAELEEELGMVTASLDARWRALVDVIADAGTRLATRVAEQDRRRQGVRTEAVPTEPTPRPAASAAVAVPAAVRPPDRVAV
ncbi:MAG: hypothetical protein H0U86_15815, partial [Chloroflexi bacterium]|nr:hypothetical protein [Chloroflexota bacterium]